MGLAAAAVSHGFDDRYIAGGGKSRIVGTAFFRLRAVLPHRSARQTIAFRQWRGAHARLWTAEKFIVRSASRWALSGQKVHCAAPLPPADRRACSGTASGWADVQGTPPSVCRTFSCGDSVIDRTVFGAQHKGVLDFHCLQILGRFGFWPCAAHSTFGGCFQAGWVCASVVDHGCAKLRRQKRWARRCEKAGDRAWSRAWAHKTKWAARHSAETARARQAHRTRASGAFFRRRTVFWSRDVWHPNGRFKSHRQAASRRCDQVLARSRWRMAAAAAYDFTVKGGSIGMTGETKVTRMRELALRARMPMVVYWLGGAMDRSAVAGRRSDFLFAGSGHLFREEALMSGVVPFVAAMVGPGRQEPRTFRVWPTLFRWWKPGLDGAWRSSAGQGGDRTGDHRTGTWWQQDPPWDIQGRRCRSSRRRKLSAADREYLSLCRSTAMKTADHSVWWSTRAAGWCPARCAAAEHAPVVWHVPDRKNDRRSRAHPRHRQSGPRTSSLVCAHRRLSGRNRCQQPRHIGASSTWTAQTRRRTLCKFATL